MGLFSKLKGALQKTKQLLNTDVRDLFKAGETLDAARLERIEAGLMKTDMGVTAATGIVEELREKHGGRTVVVDNVMATVKENLKRLLTGEDATPDGCVASHPSGDATHYDPDQPLSPLKMADSGPTVILVCGVNGAGKTTSISKLAKLVQNAKQKVILGAGDTFRAAAVEQLTMWANRLGCEIVKKESGTDPAAVAHVACERALETGAECVIIDTAGRLQTQKNLMDELGKIRRVIERKIPGAPHECLLVLDATTGQNGISQAKNFSEAAGCTGIILAKLDGTAKGGVVVAIRQQMGIPVKYIGVGEKIDDIEVFDAENFVNALIDE